MQAITRLFMTLLFVAAIAAAAGWIIGGKQTDNFASQVVDAPPGKIFPFLVEPDRMKQWFGGLVEVEPIQPNDPDARPGQDRLTRRVLQDAEGNRVAFSDKVIRYLPDAFLSITSTNANEQVTWVYELEPTNETQTKVTFRVMKKRFGLERMLAPLREDMVLEQIETDLRSLKTLVESSNGTVALAPDRSMVDIRRSAIDEIQF